MSDRVVEAIAAVVLVSCMAASGLVSRAIGRQRQDLGLVVSMEGTRGMPPHVALATAAAGTFRGLAVDVLWARAEGLQDRGEFFEAQTLARWITALQPRFPRVWAFQAWNLAYNVSVCSREPSERWEWVNRGIDLLRREGIPLNPRDANLPNELGWIYFHKIGGRTDREHAYYKARLVREFRELLGDLTGGLTSDEAVVRFRRIVDAADGVGALRSHPDAAAALGVMAAHGAEPNEAFLRMLGNAVLYDASLDTRLVAGRALPTGTNADLLAAILGDERVSRAVFDVIVPSLQKQTLVERYGMSPEFMLRLMETYGPLDWGHAHAHGIYWSERGIALSREGSHRERFNELSVVRTRLANLQYLMRSGRLEFDPLSDRLDLLPDPRFIDAYERGMQEAVQMIQSQEGLSAADFGRADVNDLLGGYESFLEQATVFAYLYGDEAQAAHCYGKLVTLAEDSGRGSQPLYTEGLESFVALRLAAVMDIDLANMRQFLDAMVQRAMLDGLAKGRLDTFNRFLRLAFTMYDRRYGVSVQGSRHVAKEAELPPFPEVVAASYESAMRQESTPILMRARIWSWTPEALRKRTWPRIGDLLRAQASAAELNPERAFPAPPEEKGSDTDEVSEGDGSPS